MCAISPPIPESALNATPTPAPHPGHRPRDRRKRIARCLRGRLAGRDPRRRRSVAGERGARRPVRELGPTDLAGHHGDPSDPRRPGRRRSVLEGSRPGRAAAAGRRAGAGCAPRRIRTAVLPARNHRRRRLDLHLEMRAAGLAAPARFSNQMLRYQRHPEGLATSSACRRTAPCPTPISPPTTCATC